MTAGESRLTNIRGISSPARIRYDGGMEKHTVERMLAGPADAEIILRLYELRTEAEMRKARAWMRAEFWPAIAEAPEVLVWRYCIRS